MTITGMNGTTGQQNLTHIVVSEENEVDDLIKFVMESEKIFGYPNVSKENRLYLVSRITSIERIELDY